MDYLFAYLFVLIMSDCVRFPQYDELAVATPMFAA